MIGLLYPCVSIDFLSKLCFNARAVLWVIKVSNPKKEKMNKKIILFIEDDEGIQRIFSIIMNSLGHVFFQAKTISEAKEIFAKEKENLTHIYVDGCVPGRHLNTIDLVREIRPEFSGKMYAISSNPEFNDILVEAGCDEGFEKFMVCEHLNMI